MNIKPIENETDCDAALAAIDRLMGAVPDTPERDALDILNTLVETCQAACWPTEAPIPFR